MFAAVAVASRAARGSAGLAARRTLASAVNDVTRSRTASELFAERIDSRFQANNKPKIVALNQLMLAVKTDDDFDLAIKTIKLYRERNVQPRDATSAQVVNWLVARGQAEKAYAMVTDKAQYGLFPLRTTYHTLMRALLAQGKDFEAYHCFERFIRDRTEAPTSLTYQLAIEAAVYSEQGAKAVKLLAAAEADGVSLPANSFQVLLGSGLLRETQAQAVTAKLVAAFPKAKVPKPKAKKDEGEATA